MNNLTDGCCASVAKSQHDQAIDFVKNTYIHSHNIGKIRSDLSLPFDCEWNAFIREITAQREKECQRHYDIMIRLAMQHESKGESLLKTGMITSAHESFAAGQALRTAANLLSMYSA